MSTTTPDGGGEQSPQPTTPEAVTTGHNADQVITTDDNGTPTMEPVQSEGAEEAAPPAEPEAPAEEAQAPAVDNSQVEEFDPEAFAKKKGIDLTKADPKTLLKMQYEAEKRMHQATEKARELETASVVNAPVDYTGDPQRDQLAQQVNTLVIQNNVRDFFQANPEAREFESKMAEIVTSRPHLQNDLDALYALAKNDPGREADIRQQGGKEALTNLAQKQQQIPPGANATNSGVYASSNVITPDNVYDLVEKNGQEWFEKNHKEISKAMERK